MQVKRIDDISDETLDSRVSFLFAVNDDAAHSIGDQANFALLPLLPHPVWHVEEQPLEEQHKRHPLVVRVIPLLASVTTQTRMSNLRTDNFVLILRQRVGVRDPAVGVQHMNWNGIVGYAVDGIACWKFLNSITSYWAVGVYK